MKKFLILLSLIGFLACSTVPSFAQEKPIEPQHHENNNSLNFKNQGIIFYTEGKYIEALNCFERVDKDFLNSDTLLLMSNCYSSLNNNKKASELLIKAIEYDPDNPFPYYNLGILHYKNNNIAVAINNFSKAISKNKNFAAAYYNIGVCYYLTKDFKKAKDNFINAQNISPDNMDICYNLVLICNALNDKQSAEKYLDIYSKITGKENKATLETTKTDINTVPADTTQNKEKSSSDISLWHNLNFKRIKNLRF